MAPYNETQLDQIRDERREQIKRAALKIFARRGIIGTKMSMIAAEAGISQGLAYRYFSSKEELFVELVREAMEEAHAAVKSLESAKAAPVDLIRELTIAMLDENNSYSFKIIQQVQASDEVPEAAKQMISQYPSNALMDSLIPIFIEGQRIGDFCKGDPRKLLMLYFSIITGLMLQDGTSDGIHWVHEIETLMKILTK
ncbi:TetR family transcriptional regulator [Paenibacillus sp. Soil766]|uniref:TetR/AcrR family transcriptional regulator n=1 Tax=Paenibacillus sp. Soil766 TaxID=1736404 RepID=UPI00070A1826|nr:TetR/AcrR family transcriptional regulator [Paenibacillus sp. Soil766]KRE99399.1 TetR family transcriptional regulator [Paenibacillus sp. Soil766]